MSGNGQLIMGRNERHAEYVRRMNSPWFDLPARCLLRVSHASARMFPWRWFWARRIAKRLNYAAWWEPRRRRKLRKLKLKCLGDDSAPANWPITGFRSSGRPIFAEAQKGQA